MIQTIDFAHAIGDPVRIIAAGDITANVTGQMNGRSCLQYRVAWWHHGERNEVWVDDWEVEAAPGSAGHQPGSAPRSQLQAPR